MFHRAMTRRDKDINTLQASRSTIEARLTRIEEHLQMPHHPDQPTTH